MLAGVRFQVPGDVDLPFYVRSHTFIMHLRTFSGDCHMRTTLVIPDAIYHRAKKAAKKQGKTLSELFAESVEIQLVRGNKPAKKSIPYRIKPVGMGSPKVDVNDREALYRAMEE